MDGPLHVSCLIRNMSTRRTPQARLSASVIESPSCQHLGTSDIFFKLSGSQSLGFTG